MTYLTRLTRRMLPRRILQQPVVVSRFLILALVSVVLMALQATSAFAQQPWSSPEPGTGHIHNTNSGNVGIGTTAPNSKLHIVGKVEVGAVTTGPGVNPTFTSPNNVPGFSQFVFYPASGTNTNLSFSAIPRGTGFPNNRAQIIVFGTDLIADPNNYEFAALRARDNDFVMGTGKSLTGVNRPFMLAAGFLSDNLTNNGQLYLATNGNVGIGTTTPTTKLHVAGDMTATGTIEGGNIKAKYQDIAEWVPASEQIPAGTVVVLDATKSNHVISSTRGYDTRVAGVVSAQPGITLGESGQHKVLVATTGRVRIKVDASQWPIQVGDLLVTSDTAGMAMKSQPLSLSGVQIHRPGTLIGKALEPLAKGRGEILVLLSLQ